MNTDFQNLLNRFKDFPVIERRPSFLEIAGFPSRETVWRNIFAFFFNPNECHGFKDLFLRSFFDALGKDEEEQGTGDWESMTVRTERQTAKGNFLDLLITCDEFAIGIEMKVNAGLYNDLADYGKLVKAKNPVDEHKVVLSVSPCDVHSDFSNLLFADFITAIKGQFGNYMLAADPQYTSFLLDFLNHVIRFIGGNAMDIDPKLLQFMQDNHTTVKLLIDEHNKLHQCLEARMAYVNDAIVGLDSIKPCLDYQRRLFSSEGKKVSKIGFKLNGIWFCCEFNVTEDYHISIRYWVDQKTPAHVSLNQGLREVEAVSKPARFTLSQPIEEIVADIEKTLLSMIGFLAEKQAAQVPQ